MVWLMFYYRSTLHYKWQYSYVLIEADKEKAIQYLNENFSFSREFILDNFLIHVHNDLNDLAVELNISIEQLKNHRHILIINKDRFNGFSDGCLCIKCKEFFPYAEPNQQDGSLICYGCRNPIL